MDRDGNIMSLQRNEYVFISGNTYENKTGEIEDKCRKIGIYADFKQV